MDATVRRFDVSKPIDELHARLDELGVEWWHDDDVSPDHTEWKTEDIVFEAIGMDGTSLVIVTIQKMTPEQAIAATVGCQPEMHICKSCGVAYELDIIDKTYGKARFCPNCGCRELYQ